MKNEDLNERHDREVEELKLNNIWEGMQNLFGMFSDEKEEPKEPSGRELNEEELELKNILFWLNPKSKEEKQKIIENFKNAKKEKQRKAENLTILAPYIDQDVEKYDFLELISNIDAKDLSEDVTIKIKQSVKLLYYYKIDNPFSFVKQYLLNEHFKEITETYMEAFEWYKLPSNPGVVKIRPNDDSISNRIDDYLGKLSDYFSETTEKLKYDLEKKFVQLLKAYIKPENFKIERLHAIVGELADELNQIWGAKAFSVKDLFYEPDIDYVVNLSLSGYYPDIDYKYNDYDGIFCTWESKEEVTEEEVRKYQKENKAKIKDAVKTAYDRFANEINKTFFPIDLHLVDFAKTIVKQSR